LFDFSKGIDASIIFLIFLPFFIQIRPILRFFSMQLHKRNAHKKSVLHVDGDWNIVESINENLGCYWECLQGIYQKRWFTKELYNRKNLNKKTLEDFGLA
jgi:hypothetical protein